MITPKNVYRHELIGLKIKIKKSTDPTQIGLKGRVIDETYKTFKIETEEGKEKIVPKDINVFVFTLPNGKKVEIDGKILVGRPEDRIKKKFARW